MQGLEFDNLFFRLRGGMFREFNRYLNLHKYTRKIWSQQKSPPSKKGRGLSIHI